MNLRKNRAFILLFTYVAMLGAVVLMAWPENRKLDLTSSPEEAKRLVNLFFAGQYVLISLMVPSFAAGAICGEKERQTYEMLLASPMRPMAILVGKLFAAMAQLAILVFASLPIVMLCLPLGGVSPYEVVATFLAMAASAMLFGSICITASAFFVRTFASLVVSYLAILPLVLFTILFYRTFEQAASFRLLSLTFVYPAICLLTSGALLWKVSGRLLYPPDIGAEAKEVVDPDLEQKQALGMVIRSEQFPDSLFAPPKRESLMEDGINPIYDKQMRSEIFGQGTLMLRIVIQVSMILAMILMAACCYIKPEWISWYAGYAVVFNILVGPVFSSGSITSERERQTLELLLTTTLSPWVILWGKLLSSLRVSFVLTAFVAWPLLLAWLLPPWTYFYDTLTFLGYIVVILLSCLSTTVLGIFCSVLCRRTSTAMLTAYVILLSLYALPLVLYWLCLLLFPGSELTSFAQRLTFTSPFAAAYSLPLSLGRGIDPVTKMIANPGNLSIFFGFLALYSTLNILFLFSIVELFNLRWKVSSQERD